MKATKLQYLIIVTVCVFIFFVENSYAQEYSFYGDSTLYALIYIKNDSYVPDIESSDFDYGIMQTISMVFNTMDFTRIFMDIDFNGSLLNIINDYSVEVSPIELNVNQFYIQMPLLDNLIFYGGKRIKEIGKSEAFPITNRINPRLYSNINISSVGAGLLELDFFPTMWLNTALITFFKDIDWTEASWDMLNFLIQLDFNFNPISFSIYSYMEQFKYFPVGLSTSIQIDYLTLFCEYVISNQSDIMIIDDPDSSDIKTAFKLRDSGITHRISTGLKFQLDDFSIDLEYSFNSSALNAEEADAIYNYINDFSIPSLPKTDENLEFIEENKQDMIFLYRNRKNFFPHNLFLELSLHPAAFPDFQLSLGTKTSFIDLDVENHRFLGLNINAEVIYMINQAITAVVRSNFYGGFESSEFVLYEQNMFDTLLAIQIRY